MSGPPRHGPTDPRLFGLSEEDLRKLGYSVGPRRGGSAEPEEEPASPRGGRPRAQARARRIDPALRLALATVVALGAAAWGASPRHRLPSPVQAGANGEAFSSSRAMAQLVEIAGRPRPVGSPEHERVRGYLESRLAGLGLTPEVQTVTAHLPPTESGLVVSATVRNVVAKLPGTASTGAVALVARYDGAPHSPAASDGAFGLATVLETVRTLTAGTPLRNDVIVVLADADELGLLGTRAFAERHPWADDVAVALSVDAHGAVGPALAFESAPGNARLAEALARVDVRPGASSLAGTLLSPPPDSIRLGPLLERGAGGLALVALGSPALRGHPLDTTGRVSEATLQHAGAQLVGLTRTLAGEDWGAAAAEADRVYFALPVIGPVGYPAGWTLPISLGLLVGWLLLGLLLRYREATPVGVGVGLAVGAVGVGAAALLGRGLLGVVARWHPEMGFVAGTLYRDGPHLLALVALAFVPVGAAYAVARRWLRADELYYGALALPLVLSLWVTFGARPAAYAAQWPTALGLVGLLAATLLGTRRGRSAIAWGLCALLATATVVLVEPSLEVAAATWTLRGATALGALSAVAWILLLPALDWALHPRGWWPPALAVLGAAALVALDLPALVRDSEQPVPTALVYLAESPVRNVLSGGDTTTTDSLGVRHMAGQWLTVPGPGERWARSWVAEPPTGSRDPGVLLLPDGAGWEIAGGGPESEIVAPVASVVGESLVAGRRHVRLTVRSGLAGEMTGVHLPDASGAEIVAVEGVAFTPGVTPTRSLESWGRPDTGALGLEVALPAEAPELELVVIEHHLRPPEILGDYFFQRPDSLVANVALGSDRVIQRTRLRLPIGGS